LEGRAELVAVLEGARLGGARAAEVLRVERQILEQSGSRSRPTTRAELAWVVRVYRDGGATGEGRAADPRAALGAALAEAATRPPDPNAGPVERMTVRAGGLGIDDRRYGAIEDADRSEVLQLTERAMDRTRADLRELRYRQDRTRRTWMSSRGVESEETATAFALSAIAVLGDLAVPHRIASRHFSDVASLPFGAELRKRVEALASPAARPSAALPVLLEPRVLAEVVRAFAPAFAASDVEATFLGTWLGRPLADPLLHVTDDAGLFGGLATRAFDDRGVPPIAIALLKEGVVNGLYHDPETARRHGLRPTGHVSDGALRPSNLVVRPGSRTRNVIVGELGTYLAIDRMPPLDLAAGRWRGLVPVYVCEKHDRRGCFRVEVDWPVRTLLTSLRELAADQERNGEVDAPTAVLELTLT
jgi:predicted Zn-dependent protease